jgi:hypothetical protein
MRRRITAAAIAATVGLGGLAPVALATGDCPPSKPTNVVETPKPAKPAKKAKKAKCNAGRGNGSESLENTGHCTNGDPGNSNAAGNRGGDEVPPSNG